MCLCTFHVNFMEKQPENDKYKNDTILDNSQDRSINEIRA